MNNIVGRKKIICVVGTRPECIKMAPVIAKFQTDRDFFVQVVNTGQHRELALQTLGVFDIKADINLDIMVANQTLASSTAKILSSFDAILAESMPDLVLIQGDTTTVMACSVACFFRRVPVGHVEAGLRTQDISNPFPEEFNRRVAAIGAVLHFSPTEESKQNLLREHVDPSTVFVTGNTVIDALMHVAAKPEYNIFPNIGAGKRIILVTAHRRENFGAPLQNICDGLVRIVEEFPDVEIVYPVHPNPNVRSIVEIRLGGKERFHLIKPMDYIDMVQCIKRSHFVMTDSGGLQEEAPAFSKPVLVLRDDTERPEAVRAGVAKLVGSNSDKIFDEASKLLNDPAYYSSMAVGASPYGDGKAAVRIWQACKNYLSLKDQPDSSGRA